MLKNHECLEGVYRPWERDAEESIPLGIRFPLSVFGKPPPYYRKPFPKSKAVRKPHDTLPEEEYLLNAPASAF